MRPILSDTIPTPIGPIIMLARHGVMLLLEFSDADDRVERDMKVRFGDAELVPTKNPFGFSECITNYFAGDLAAIDTIPTDGNGTDFQQRV